MPLNGTQADDLRGIDSFKIGIVDIVDVLAEWWKWKIVVAL